MSFMFGGVPNDSLYFYSPQLSVFHQQKRRVLQFCGGFLNLQADLLVAMIACGQ